MNCSTNCKWCRSVRYVRKYAKDFIIITLVLINLLSLMYRFCLIGYAVSWWSRFIMLINILFLCLVAYANGFYEPEPSKQGEKRRKRMKLTYSVSKEKGSSCYYVHSATEPYSIIAGPFKTKKRALRVAAACMGVPCKTYMKLRKEELPNGRGKEL